MRSVWYLIAYDLDRDDWRVFRVDRMAGDVERTGHGVTRRSVPGGPLAFLAASLADMTYAHTASVELAVDRDVALAEHPWVNAHRVEQARAGSCRVQLGAADLGELTRQVVDLIGRGRVRAVRAPEAVRAHLVATTGSLHDALDKGAQ